MSTSGFSGTTGAPRPSCRKAAFAVTPSLILDPTVQKIIREIIRPFIALLFILAILYFVWGLSKFIWSMSKGDLSGKDSGRKHMIYSVIGLAIMISAFGIMRLIFDTVIDVGGSRGVSNNTIPPPIDRF